MKSPDKVSEVLEIFKGKTPDVLDEHNPWPVMEWPCDKCEKPHALTDKNSRELVWVLENIPHPTNIYKDCKGFIHLEWRVGNDKLSFRMGDEIAFYSSFDMHHYMINNDWLTYCK